MSQPEPGRMLTDDEGAAAVDRLRGLSILDALDRIERKVDALLTLITEEEPEEEPARTLDGQDAGAPRDTSAPP